jgi:large subunit ribosomal protein L3
VSHNKPGSIGQNQDPGRVFPGKRMAGHLGAVRSTVQNVEIIRVDAERGLLLIRGALPGSRGGGVTVKPTVRAARATVAQPAKPAAGAGKPAAPRPAAEAKPATKK